MTSEAGPERERDLGWITPLAHGYFTNGWINTTGFTIRLTSERVIVKFLGLFPYKEIPLKSITRVSLTPMMTALRPGVNIYFTEKGKEERFSFGMIGVRKRVLEKFKALGIVTQEVDDFERVDYWNFE